MKKGWGNPIIGESMGQPPADLGDGFDCAPMPPLVVKGKSQPLAVLIVRWMGAE